MNASVAIQINLVLATMNAAFAVWGWRRGSRVLSVFNAFAAVFVYTLVASMVAGS